MIRKQEKQFVLAGGGLVGSLLATVLGKRGFSVQVVEKRPDFSAAKLVSGRSINLALANRGILPLEKAGVMPEISKIIIPMRGRAIHTLDGGYTFQAYGQRPEEVIYSVSRGELNKVLIEQAKATGNVTFNFESSVQSVNLAEKLLVVEGKEGKLKQIPYDFLFGADGSGSEVRREILRKNKGTEDVAMLDHSYKELHIEPGPNGTFQLEKEVLHIWPRGDFMMIALPNPDGSFTATLFMPTSGEISFESLRSRKEIEEFFKKYFHGVIGKMGEYVDSFLKNPIGSLGTVRCYPWAYQDSAMLIGDAAHAIVPFHGQGMNCGFEDCAEIDVLFEEGVAFDEWPERFQKARKANADAIAELALANYFEMRSSVMDAKFLQKKKMEFELERLFPNQYIPKYSRVMFHHTPYSEAQRLGELQETILEKLYDDFLLDEKIPFEKAKSLVSTLLR
jgi:kynurenine 3-monooxygenase